MYQSLRRLNFQNLKKNVSMNIKEILNQVINNNALVKHNLKINYGLFYVCVCVCVLFFYFFIGCSIYRVFHI